MSFKIVFMGTPDFAVASLKAIADSGIEVAGVITAPDKPAGRGKKIQCSAVKQFALDNNIETILQPTNLKDADFQEKLKSIGADLFVVVAFRMLPEAVWNMPPLGTINLHASLLPNYRGAAPINWAVINGEKVSGVTTFFIKHEIDTGNIIQQKEVEILSTDTAGSYHDKLMIVGADLLVETVKSIEQGNCSTKNQDELISGTVKEAPKIFKDDCRINWNQPAEQVYNFIRGLSPYPAAWTEFTSEGGEKINYKIFESSIISEKVDTKPGTIDYSQKGEIRIACQDYQISVLTLQQSGKKRMDCKSYLLGFNGKEKFLNAI